MSNAREIADLGTLFDASNNLTTSGTVTADAIVPNGNVTFTTGDRVIGNGDEKIKFDSTNQDIEIQTADNVAMLIDSAQRVIIGHNANINNYDVQLNSTGTAIFSSTSYANNSSGSTQRLGKSRGATIDSNVLTVDGDQIGTIQFSGNDGSGFHTVAQIQCLQDGATGNNDLPGALRFQTTADGASSPTERMRIDSDGNVGIGTSSPSTLFGSGNTLHISGATGGALRLAQTNNAVTSDLYSDSEGLTIRTQTSHPIVFKTANSERIRITSNGRLCVGTTAEDSSIVNIERTDHTQFGLKIEQTSGTVNFTIAELLRLTVNGTNAETPFQRFFGNTTELGEIRINSTSNGTQYLTTSDYRLKENVVDMTDSITRLNQLRPVNYNFIGNAVVTDGFLAHEVQDIVPSAVAGQKDAVKEDGSIRPQMIEMSSMIPLLTAALKEAIARIEALENA